MRCIFCSEFIQDEDRPKPNGESGSYYPYHISCGIQKGVISGAQYEVYLLYTVGRRPVAIYAKTNNQAKDLSRGYLQGVGETHGRLYREECISDRIVVQLEVTA